jgi:hypothetical protein
VKMRTDMGTIGWVWCHNYVCLEDFSEGLTWYVWCWIFGRYRKITMTENAWRGCCMGGTSVCLVLRGCKHCT